MTALSRAQLLFSGCLKQGIGRPFLFEGLIIGSYSDFDVYSATKITLGGISKSQYNLSCGVWSRVWSGVESVVYTYLTLT